MPAYELKAWIKDKKRMVNVKSLDFITGNISYRFNNATHYATYDEIELRECTKFKDKNNQKIFDGDIVQVGDSICKIIYTKFGNCLLWWLKGNFEYDKNIEKLKNGDCKIIGNIYESPELWRGKKNDRK